MFTPGYEVENQTKPKITKRIEETDDGLTAEQAASGLFKGTKRRNILYIMMIIINYRLGIERGHTHITADPITNLFRASTRGAAPRNNWILDGLYDFIGYVRPRLFQNGLITD